MASSRITAFAIRGSSQHMPQRSCPRWVRRRGAACAKVEHSADRSAPFQWPPAATFAVPEHGREVRGVCYLCPRQGMIREFRQEDYALYADLKPSLLWL